MKFPVVEALFELCMCTYTQHCKGFLNRECALCITKSPLTDSLFISSWLESDHRGKRNRIRITGSKETTSGNRES
jgi:hypothetical protein